MPRPSLIDRAAALATSHPVKVVVVVGLLTALSLLALRGLRLGGSIYDLFPDRPGPIAELRRYIRTLAGGEELVVLITGPEADAVERATRRVAGALERSPLVGEVRARVAGAAMADALGQSLLLLAGPDAWPHIERRLTVELEPQVARLRQILLSPVSPDRTLLQRDPLLLAEFVLQGVEVGVNRRSGLYAAADGRATLIFARPVRPSSDITFCRELQHHLQALRQDQGEGIALAFTGAHLYAFHTAAALEGDLTLSGLLALAGVALVQIIFFRSLRLVPLSALVAGVALCWTLAIAALTVGTLNALSLSFAALCIGMGDDALIHIAAGTRAHAADPPALRLRRAVSALAPALLAATLTIIAAFVSFSLSAFAGLAHTGLLSACGLALIAILAVCFFPALGTLFPPGPGPSGETLIDRWLEGLSALAQRRRYLVIGGALLLAAASLLLARDLRFSADLTRLAPAAIPPAQTDRAIARRFERDRNRLIVLLAGRDLEQVLRANDALADRLERLRGAGAVAGYLSLSRLLPARATQERRRQRLRALDPEAVAQRLAASLEAAGMRAESFAPAFAALRQPRVLTLADLPRGFKPLVGRHLARDRDGQAVVATILYPRPGVATETFHAALTDLAPPGVTLGLTGAGPAGQQMAALLRGDLLLVSLTTLAAVALILGLLMRRLWPIVATLLSLLLAGATFAGCLRLLGLEVDAYNLMVLPVIIGYGVNDHLYLVHRSLRDGVQAGMVHGGRPVLAATLSTIAALGALVFCQLPGLRGLGLTGVLGLGLGMMASLVVMPALLALVPSYRREMLPPTD